jgi:hypothetical protein
VDCVLSLGRGLVLVRGGGACSAVGGGLRSGATLVDVRLDVVPLPPRSSSPTIAVCRLGGYPAGRDWWGGKRVVGGVFTPHSHRRRRVGRIEHHDRCVSTLVLVYFAHRMGFV